MIVNANLELLPPIKDLAGRHSILRVEHVPVVYSLCADKRKCCLADPPPELNVLLMAVSLQALLGLEVEELQRPSLRLESYDGLGQVHDGTVRADRSSDDIVCVLQINDDRLRGGIGFAVDLAHANVLVGLERLESLSAHLPMADYMESVHLRSSAMISMLAISFVSFLSYCLRLGELGWI